MEVKNRKHSTATYRYIRFISRYIYMCVYLRCIDKIRIVCSENIKCALHTIKTYRNVLYGNLAQNGGRQPLSERKNVLKCARLYGFEINIAYRILHNGGHTHISFLLVCVRFVNIYLYFVHYV